MYLGTTLKLLTKTLASCMPQGPQEGKAGQGHLCLQGKSPQQPGQPPHPRERHTWPGVPVDLKLSVCPDLPTHLASWGLWWLGREGSSAVLLSHICLAAQRETWSSRFFSPAAQPPSP